MCIRDHKKLRTGLADTLSRCIPLSMSSNLDDQYRLRKRPQSEKLVDSGFKSLAVGLASVVALVLFAILIVVFQGGLPSMLRYGWDL